ALGQPVGDGYQVGPGDAADIQHAPCPPEVQLIQQDLLGGTEPGQRVGGVEEGDQAPGIPGRVDVSEARDVGAGFVDWHVIPFFLYGSRLLLAGRGRRLVRADPRSPARITGEILRQAIRPSPRVRQAVRYSTPRSARGGS